MRTFLVICLVPALLACGGGDSDSESEGHPARGLWALYFDGELDRVSVESPSWGSTSLAAGFTLEAWIYPYILTSDPDYAGIVQLDTHPLTLDDDYGGGDQSRLVQSVSIPFTESAVSDFDTVQAGVWQHVAGTYDGTTIRIYKNGVQVGQQSHPGSTDTAQSLLIGRFSGSFHGLLDEIRVWGIPRTASQIAGSMNIPLSGSESGLLGYYRFEGTGQEVIDSSARGAHGFLGVTGADESTDPDRVTE